MRGECAGSAVGRWDGVEHGGERVEKNGSGADGEGVGRCRIMFIVKVWMGRRCKTC